MKQLPVGIGLAVLAGLIVSAQQTGSVEREVQRMEQAANDAFVKKDRAALERVFADAYSYIHSNGSVANKTQELSDAMSPDVKWTSSTLTDVKVRVHGDAAILTGIETLQGTAKGYVPGPRRVTDLWVNRNGRWQRLGGQSTIVSNDTSNTAALSAVKTLTPKAAIANTAEERAVARADEAYAKADGANDDAKTTALQTKDYSFVSRLGVVASPNDPPGTPTKSMAVAYDRIRMVGTLAVVQGSLLWSDVKGFSPGVLRFTRVWVKDGNAWKLAAEQRTAVAATRPTS
jgi:ketosteroid isomerase-like protein